MRIMSIKRLRAFDCSRPGIEPEPVRFFAMRMAEDEANNIRFIGRARPVAAQQSVYMQDVYQLLERICLSPNGKRMYWTCSGNGRFSPSS